MLRKFFLIFTIFALITGCSDTKDDNRIQVICTAFPQYDWAKELTKGSEDFNITLLTDNGTDMHNFQPSAEDIIRICSCDLLIYTGGESEKWVLDATQNNPDIKIVDMLSATDERHHDHDHELPDEHTWLSIKDSISICNEISLALQDIIPEKSGLILENTENYTTKLSDLDTRYSSVIDNASGKVLVFADRFPFSRMAEDYSVTCHAAFPGCSAETEASFETVARLARAVDENHLDTVMITDNSKTDLAKTVIESTKEKNQNILSLNSMQTVTAKDLSSEFNYIDTMESNLEILKIALN